MCVFIYLRHFKRSGIINVFTCMFIFLCAIRVLMILMSWEGQWTIVLLLVPTLKGIATQNTKTKRPVITLIPLKKGKKGLPGI